MHTLGARLAHVDKGRCDIEVAFDETLTQQHGLFHGGVVASIADNAAGFAAYSLMREGRQPLTIEFKINLLAPARGSLLIARGEVLRAGRSIFHVRCDVYCRNDDEDQLVATALVTIKATSAVTEV